MTEGTARIVAVLKGVPRGEAWSYGAVAAAAGFPNGARQVVRILHALGAKEALPWHRIVRADGSIALRPGEGFELQRALLEAEGVGVDKRGRVAPDRFRGRLGITSPGRSG
jgi:methylated-DNA-protein-cysteine methyltransferase-like protein